VTDIDLGGPEEPVILVDGRAYRRVDDITDPAAREIAADIWAEFQAVRHLAEPVAETLARLGRTAGGPVRIGFADPASFEAALGD
jgi:hypothetical protein